MIDTHLNIFDTCVISIMLLSCLFAFYRGLVREILSLAAWVGAGIITLCYYHTALEKMQPYFKTTAAAIGAATIGLYIISLIGFAIVNTIIIKTIKSSGETGPLDNMLGLLFGAMRGALIVSLGFFLISKTLPEKEYPEWITKSVTRPYVEKGAMALAKIAPEYMKELSAFQQKATDRIRSGQQDGQEPQDQQEQPQADENAAPIINGNDNGGGYSRTANQQMDRLIDNAAQQHQ